MAVFLSDCRMIEVNPKNNPPNTSIIWLHGLGATANDFPPIIPELALPDDLSIRFIFPQAPSRPVTLNFGYVMPAWYDIYSLDRGGLEDEEGIQVSSQMIAKLIAKEKEKGIPANRILLAGFSQGGAVALYTALHEKEPLAGVLALSTYLPLATQKHPYPKQQGLPVFMAHGKQDAIVQLSYAEFSRDLLVDFGCEVQWKTYNMGHEVCKIEIEEIGLFIQETLF